MANELCQREFRRSPRDKQTYVLTTDGYTLVGTITICQKPLNHQPVHFLEDLAIVERFRGNGYSRKLVKRALNEIKGDAYVECDQPKHWNIFLQSGFDFVGFKAGKPVNVPLFKFTRRKENDANVGDASDDSRACDEPR